MVDRSAWLALTMSFPLQQQQHQRSNDKCGRHGRTRDGCCWLGETLHLGLELDAAGLRISDDVQDLKSNGPWKS